MLVVYLKLQAKEDIPKAGWKKGEYLEMENNIFSKQTGFVFESLDKRWEIIKMKVKKYEEVNND